MNRPPVRAVVIVVPARDEADRIDACLAAITRALPSLPTVVCVVADRCRDTTGTRAGAHDGVVIVENAAELAIGEVRNLGFRAVLDVLVEPPDQIWLLSTDADSTVPSAWVADHVARADAGADAVVGPVELDDPTSLPTDVLRRYIALTDAEEGGVYAANLGVRADAYLQIGGFPAVASGEEHALLHRLRLHRRPVVSTDVTVRTSARLQGRARSGLADLLSGMRPTRAGDGPAMGTLDEIPGG